MKTNNHNIKKPLIISGPCSAESREQVLAIAKQIKDDKIDYFRAGIWKPRTQPGAFEGIGREGLAWLQEVKKEYKIPVCTEVANVKHIYESLKAGLDMIWIGSRTASNPFSVQEIAESLRGVEITVMIKNPINPDLKLWIGGIERLRACGIKDIAAIHRGFSVYEKIKYRYQPKWQIAVDFQHELPEIPLICDPSHIGGKREFIQDLSQKAMDLNFDGLMIETHCDPDAALTDARQQVTPKRFSEIISRLVLRDQVPTNSKLEELNALREQINVLDHELLQVLSNRMSISRKIGNFKMRNNIKILQNKRWENLLRTNISAAKQEKMSSSFAEDLFKLIHQESIHVQESILNKDANSYEQKFGH